MKIHIDNDIEIFEPTSAILNFCRDKLVLDNPDFYKLLRLGKYTGNTPETIALYERQGDILTLPFGCLQAVWKLYPHKEDYAIALCETGKTGLEYPNDLTLFDYQKSVLLSAVEKKNGVIVMPCGSGKTCVGLAIVAEKKARALWLTHTGELLRQSKKRAESIFDLPKNAFGTITEGKIDIGTHITFATVQTMCKIDLEKYRDYWDMVIVDECLPGDTKIITEKGEKCLKNLLKGDIITSYNRHNKRLEKKRVTHLFKHKAHDIVKVKLENGEEIVATKNHPFYTSDDKWVNAENLGGNDYVMRLVQTGVRRNDETKNNAKQNKKTWIRILLQRMFDKSWTCKRCVDGRTKENIIGNDEAHKREVSRSVCGTHEAKQSDEKSGCKTISIKKIERDWTSSENQMRQRSRIDCTTTEFDDCVSEESDRDICRISDTDKNAERKRLSDVLQGRYCFTRVYGRGRDRRKVALCNSKTRAGREERQFFEWVRVASVEIQKSTSDGTFGGLCEDGFVYNIEVEDNNNYFANGVLVHNCQHCCGSPTRVTQFYKCLSGLSARYKIGLTATPKRADGLQRSMFALLGDKICEVKRENIPTCPIKVQAYKTHWSPDIDDITAEDGTLDYNALVKEMISSDERFATVTAVIVSLLGKGAMIVLANRVEYLKRLQQAVGARSICLSGAGNSKKVKQERAEALEKLNAGKIDCIFATYQLSAEGLDVPQLRYVVFATPEKDETKVTQSVGRVGRLAEGKEIGTVIDFVDDFFMYENWFKKRKTIYRKLGCDVDE